MFADGRFLHVRLDGSLELASAPVVRCLAGDVLAAAEVTVDTTRVTFADAAGVGEVIRLLSAAEGAGATTRLLSGDVVERVMSPVLRSAG